MDQQNSNSVYFGPADSISYSFRIGFSELSIHRIIGITTTFYPKLFIKLIEQMIEFISQKCIFVADNAAINKTTKVTKYFEENKQIMITLPYYYPQMSSVENLIEEINEKILKQHKTGKFVSLQMIKKIVFAINQRNLQSNFNKSHYDIAMFVHSMQIKFY